MLLRLLILFILLPLLISTGTSLLSRVEPVYLLDENPLQLAAEMLEQDRLDEAELLARFTVNYLPVEAEYSTKRVLDEIETRKDSSLYLLERFIEGALYGEPADTPGLLGTVTLDMMVIGDIRDLLVQGYKEYDRGEGDEVISALAAVGLLLTLVPELSWAPAVFKTFWRGRRFSPHFQKQMRQALSEARRTGDYRNLKIIFGNFQKVVDRLGTGPAMAVMKQVNTADDLARLAAKAKFAPAETYTLTRISGIGALQNISTTGTKSGKLVKKVKLAVRQQKIFGKVMKMIPVSWLLAVFTASLFSIVLIISRERRKGRRRHS